MRTGSVYSIQYTLVTLFLLFLVYKEKGCTLTGQATFATTTRGIGIVLYSCGVGFTSSTERLTHFHLKESNIKAEAVR